METFTCTGCGYSGRITELNDELRCPICQTSGWIFGSEEEDKQERKNNRDQADLDFSFARQLARQYGFSLIRHSDQHYKVKTEYFSLEVYPGNGRLYHRNQQHRIYISVPPVWTLIDVVEGVRERLQTKYFVGTLKEEITPEITVAGSPYLSQDKHKVGEKVFVTKYGSGRWLVLFKNGDGFVLDSERLGKHAAGRKTRSGGRELDFTGDPPHAHELFLSETSPHTEGCPPKDGEV